MLFRSPTLLALTALCACGGGAKATPATVGGPPHDAKVVAWRCSDLDVVFFPGQGVKAKLRVNGDLRDLTLKVTGATIEYADEQVAFSSHGAEAKVTLPDMTRLCYYDPSRTELEEARLRGITFRATGGTPSWVLEIGSDKTSFSGPTPVEAPTSAPTTDAATGALTWSAAVDTHALTTTATPVQCTSTTGRVSDWKVAVTLDGTSFEGCGDSLQ